MIEKGKVDLRLESSPRLSLGLDTSSQQISGNIEMEKDLQIPNKKEMAEMFKELEKTIKQEMVNIRNDLGHLLVRVEETEEKVKNQTQAISELEKEIINIGKVQEKLLYKAEIQENRDRRRNIRIRGVPENPKGEILQEVVCKILNSIMDGTDMERTKIEGIFRKGKLQGNLGKERPRDILVNFYELQDKEKIWRKIKGKSVIKYEGKDIQIYADLSPETLWRRRTLRPLLERLKEQNVQYRWGIPECLIGWKNGGTAYLRFQEDLKNFCDRLKLQRMEIPGWEEEHWEIRTKRIEDW
ncbi:unnamed protein product [Staurois parvus]|uniref:L1 transposable element RRM domain-containing protein n=1 Tax=Staurois parvus TaxID=386267 RepID=A0ABN9ASN7_9NEOB|nr:unnamed protein product [Staurois parvus]